MLKPSEDNDNKSNDSYKWNDDESDIPLEDARANLNLHSEDYPSPTKMSDTDKVDVEVQEFD